jgi:23S rRNA (cytidine1920-2'-O)/16S rRNA (cytidine1409-2'-O)-methyltransferase
MRERLDLLLVERRLVESRTKAQWLIKNGFVLVNNAEILKPGKKIDNTSDIQLKADFPYVGRGGLKLEAALKDFNIDVKDKVCADLGASIGGFTDCLIKNGAKKVYAIDIAEDLLHPSLRCEKMEGKVIPLLGVDVRELKSLNERVDIATIDITFASLRVILANTNNFLKENGDIITLVKPLFETNFYEETKFKVIKEKEKLQSILIDLINWSKKIELYPHGIIKSPILGKGGAIEFFINFRNKLTAPEYDYKEEIEKMLN